MAQIRLWNIVKNLPEGLEKAAGALQGLADRLEQGKAAFLTYPLAAMLGIGAVLYEMTSKAIGKNFATQLIASVWGLLGASAAVATALHFAAAMPVVLTIAAVGAAAVVAPRVLWGACAGLCAMAGGLVYGVLTMGRGVKNTIEAWEGKNMNNVAILTVTAQPGAAMTGPMRAQMMTPAQKALEALEGASEAEREKFAKSLVEKFPDMRAHIKGETAAQEVPTVLAQDVAAPRPRIRTGA